ncbi:hypothetical protein HZB78_06250 [Candidatus Collierbacteria bacterium]|nr:hypothetical protein [Candidatus Collierbacteria bacterium]
MKAHKWALILAIICGLIVGLPHFLIPKLITPQTYDPLHFYLGQGSSITMEEVYTYVPEVREILEGKFWVTDTQVAEYSGRPTPFAGETGLAWVMAGLVKLTGSMENAFMAADFLFPAITFLLVYAIMISFAKEKIFGLAAGAIVVLWPEIIALIPYPAAILSSIKSAFNPRDFLFISRNFHPQLSLPAYLFAFWCLLRPGLATARPGLLRLVAAGLAIGFLFYTYIFNWTAFGLGLGLFFVSVVLLGIKRPGLGFPRPGLNTVRYLSVILVVAGLVAAPYFLQVWQFRQSGLAADFFAKLSLPKRGFFDLTARHWIFVLVFLILNFGKVISNLPRDLAERFKSSRSSIGTRFLDFARNDGKSLILFLCFWIAPLILPDLMQNLLGRDLEGKHWIRRIAYPFGIMGLSIAISQIINKKWIKLICVPLILLVLAYGLIRQTKMSYKIAGSYALNPDKQELYDWINQNAVPSAVIMSWRWDEMVNIPAQTHAFNFSPIGMRSILPINEAIDRYLWQSAIRGESIPEVKKAFSSIGEGGTREEGEALSRVFYFTYADENIVFNFPDEKITEIINKYKKNLALVDDGKLPPYRLNYILVVKSLKFQPKKDLRTIEFNLIFNNSDYEIWGNVK